jgi:hypothetical protein
MELSTPESPRAPSSDAIADERLGAVQTAVGAPASMVPDPGLAGQSAPVAVPVRAAPGLIVLGTGDGEMCSDGFCS